MIAMRRWRACAGPVTEAPNEYQFLWASGRRSLSRQEFVEVHHDARDCRKGCDTGTVGIAEATKNEISGPVRRLSEHALLMAIAVSEMVELGLPGLASQADPDDISNPLVQACARSSFRTPRQGPRRLNKDWIVQEVESLQR